MPKTYPAKIDLFLAAESMRQETGGKVTIIGAYAGGKILLPPKTVLPAHMPFAVMFAFYDGEGNFDTKLRLSDQSGKHGPDLPTGNITKQPEFAMQILVNFGIFEIGSLGRYTIEVFLDDHSYTEHLTFGVSDKPFT